MRASLTPEGSGSPELTPTQNLRPVQLVLLCLAFVTLFRLWYSTHMGLVADEAYYWVWSKHLAASYRDKGPAVAWTIALGRTLFGDTVFGIRIAGVLLGTGTAWQLFRLAQKLYGDRTALWCLVVALFIPIFAIGSILMTIDSLSVFFWAWAANLLWSGLEGGRLRHWLLLGLAVGIGSLAKFTNGVQLACFALFLCWSRPHRHFLFSRQSLVTVLAFSFCMLPMLWWNMQTGWIHFQALHQRSGVEGSFGIHPGELWKYLGGQLAVMSPLLAVGMVVAAIGCWRSQGGESRVKYLLTQFVPLQALFLFFSINKAGEANWTAPSLISGIVLLVAFWREAVRRQPQWHWGVRWGLGVAVVMTVLMHLMPLLNLPRQMNPLRRAEGWPDFAKHVQQARVDNHADLLTADHYSLASLMQFYLPDQPVTYLPPAPYGSSQFTLWPQYKVTPGVRALYVTDSGRPDPVAAALRSQFDRCVVVDDFWSRYRGQQIFRFRIYLLTKD